MHPLIVWKRAHCRGRATRRIVSRAELVAWRHARHGADEELSPAEAVDPVCGMVVAVRGSEFSSHEGVAYFFCSSGCRARVEREPAKYARTTR